ncbi:MAG: NAD(FAD)-dependent dehydrogenase [Pseudomonadota bacterium]|jgi:sulfide:quinone oxidoreductase
MPVQALSPDFAVTGQIAAQDAAAIAQAGFRSIVCNRPDGEGGPAQPPFQAIEQAAAQAGLQARYLPVVAGQITAADGAALARLLLELPAPVLAYCRSGARSTTLWQLAQAQQ